ncbi:hypothetical protein [Ferroacidibacillus organovorans]|nr:hypothetical protein [Ferroacidibacillus organovorans]
MEEKPIKLNPDAARLILRLCVEAIRRANAKRGRERVEGVQNLQEGA